MLGPNYDEFSILSLYQTAEVLHTANQIRFSKPLRSAFAYNLQLGRISVLMEMEYEICEMALKCNGQSASLAMQKRFFYFCSYYRNYLKRCVNHYEIKTPVVKACGSNKEDSIRQYKNLHVGMRYVE